MKASADLHLFPLTRRIGKIRDVAKKLAAKSSDKHAEYYRDQVSRGLERHLVEVGLGNDEVRREMVAFWRAVQLEILASVMRGNRPDGSAA